MSESDATKDLVGALKVGGIPDAWVSAILREEITSRGDFAALTADDVMEMAWKYDIELTVGLKKKLAALHTRLGGDPPLDFGESKRQRDDFATRSAAVASSLFPEAQEDARQTLLRSNSSELTVESLKEYLLDEGVQLPPSGRKADLLKLARAASEVSSGAASGALAAVPTTLLSASKLLERGPWSYGGSFLAEACGPIPWLASAADPLQQVSSILERLGNIRGKTSDKGSVPHMVIVGVGGQGKTTVLKLLQRNLDADFRDANSDQQLPLVAGVTSWVVVIATFNQATATKYRATRDTETAICATTAARWVNDFSGAEVRWPEREEVFNFEVAARMLRGRRGQPPEEVGLLLCVDELLKITDEATRNRLLDELGAFQQSELNSGRMTAIIVSSLEAKPVNDEWETQAKREVAPITLPPLDVDVFVERVKAKMQGMHDADDRIVRLRGAAHMSAGHGRLLEQLYKLSTEPRVPGVQQADEFISRCTKSIQFEPANDFGVFWGLMARRLCDPSHSFVVNRTIAFSEELPRLAARGSIVWYLNAGNELVVEPIPLALLRAPPFDSAMTNLTNEIHARVVHSMSILGYALHDVDEMKNWETGIIAAMAMRPTARCPG